MPRLIRTSDSKPGPQTSQVLAALGGLICSELEALDGLEVQGFALTTTALAELLEWCQGKRPILDALKPLEERRRAAIRPGQGISLVPEELIPEYEAHHQRFAAENRALRTAFIRWCLRHDLSELLPPLSEAETATCILGPRELRIWCQAQQRLTGYVHRLTRDLEAGQKSQRGEHQPRDGEAITAVWQVVREVAARHRLVSPEEPTPPIHQGNFQNLLERVVNWCRLHETPAVTVDNVRAADGRTLALGLATSIRNLLAFAEPLNTKELTEAELAQLRTLEAAVRECGRRAGSAQPPVTLPTDSPSVCVTPTGLHLDRRRAKVKGGQVLTVHKPWLAAMKDWLAAAGAAAGRTGQPDFGQTMKLRAGLTALKMGAPDHVAARILVGEQSAPWQAVSSPAAPSENPGVRRSEPELLDAWGPEWKSLEDVVPLAEQAEELENPGSHERLVEHCQEILDAIRKLPGPGDWQLMVKRLWTGADKLKGRPHLVTRPQPPDGPVNAKLAEVKVRELLTWAEQFLPSEPAPGTAPRKSPIAAPEGEFSAYSAPSWTGGKNSAKGDAETPGNEKASRPTTNTLMIDLLQKLPEAAQWTLAQWSARLKRAESTIVDTATWRSLMQQREAAKVARLMRSETSARRR